LVCRRPAETVSHKYVIDEELQHTDDLFLGVACFTFLNFVWKICAFNFTYRYIDDVLSINNSRFAEFLPLICPPELEVKETTDTASVFLQRRQICYRWGTPAYWSLVPQSSMFYLFEFCLKNMWNSNLTQQILSHSTNGYELCLSSSRFMFILIWVGVSSKACKR
jgi:hypothetical protein